MRFYTKQHPFYCGIDLHARSMYVCILSQDGEIVLHRNMRSCTSRVRVNTRSLPGDRQKSKKV